jgi:hypothetical protein
VVKVAENTSFAITGPQGYDTSVYIGLIYGRLRVVTNPGGENLVIQTGGNSQANINLSSEYVSDVNVDYTILSDLLQGGSGQINPRLQIHVFRGQADLSMQGSEGARRNITVKEFDWISLDNNAPFSLVERKSLNPEIIDYWDRYQFAGTPSAAAPDTGLPDRARFGSSRGAESVRPPRSGDSLSIFPRERIGLIKNGVVIGGTVFIAAGMSLQFYSYINASSKDAGKAERAATTNWVSYIPLSVGLVSLITSLFINPAIP